MHPSLMTDCTAGLRTTIRSLKQAGFRKGYIFSLYAATQKYLSKPAKLYACFVDLQRAYDSVRHSTLLRALMKSGVSGIFVKAVIAMYDFLKARVRVRDGLTDCFDCPQGLRQGCVASTTFFSLVINELAEQLSMDGKHGIQLWSGLAELFVLLFADDLALLSCSPPGLQTQLIVLLVLAVNLACKSTVTKLKSWFSGKVVS